MTPDKDIQELTDAELNEAVALEVMNAVPYNQKHLQTAQFVYFLDDEYGAFRGERYVYDDDEFDYNCTQWSPTTDIAAAWLVINKLMDTNFMVSVNQSHESGCWAVIYPATGAAIESEYCESAPRAIAEAALAAVRKEKE